MTRRFVAVLSVVLVVGGVLAAGPAIAVPGAGARLAARAGSPELSVTSRLQDRREVAAGTRD